MHSCGATFLLFFSSYRAPQYLRSFPTRRSSDLVSGKQNASYPRRSASVASAMSTSRRFSSGMSDTPMRERLTGPSLYRSEEHTSELQSHSDLVCRLLLEKKKDKRQKHTRRTCRQ